MSASAPIVLIAALDRARAIGIGNRLPWHLPDDLQRFKRLTLDHAVLMGRRTAESLGRALPGRDNLVLTRGGRAPHPGMRPVASLDEARALATSLRSAERPLMVIGGGDVYALALPLAERLHLTHVDIAIADADTWFPAVDPTHWRCASREEHPADARHAAAFAFADYVRRA